MTMELTRLHRGLLLMTILGIGIVAASGTLLAATAATATAPATTSTAKASFTVESAEAPPDMAKMAEEVALEVEALRGWKFKNPVPRRVCTEAQARAYMEKIVDRDAPPEKVAVAQAFLKAIGLLPPEADLKKTYIDLMSVQAAAFYDIDTKALYMVRPNGAKPPAAMDQVILSHELCHALDDQQLDLAKFVKGRMGKSSEDEDLVTSCVAEGSATALMIQYMAKMQASGKLDLGQMMEYSKEEEAKNQVLLAAPPYFLSMLGAYVCGMNFLARGDFLGLAMGGKNVGPELTAAMKDPPRSTEQILHPEKYWDAAKRDEPVLVNDEDMVAALRILDQAIGLHVVYRDTAGEMLCTLLTMPRGEKPNPMLMGLPPFWVNEAATGWGGDRFYLLAPGKSDSMAEKETAKGNTGGSVWITLWDTEKDRDEFVKAYEAVAMPNRVTYKWGSQGAVFFYDLKPGLQKLVEQALEKSPPHMTKDGKPWAPWVQ
jgi:hypothetical protein